MQPTILVAAGPEQARRAALALALWLARPLGGRLVLARVVLGHGRRPTHATQLRTARRDLERLRGSGVCGATVDIDVISSPSLLRGLHDAAVIHDADLLVLAGGHRTAIERAMRGDLAADVLFTAPCVVAIATGQRHLEDAPKRIGAAWNATAESDEAVQWAVRLSEPTGGVMQIVRVLEPRHPEGTTPEAGTDEQVQNLAYTLSPRVAVETKLPWGDAAAMLCEVTRDLDLLVLGSRARSGLRRVVHGSVSTDVLHGAPAGRRPPGRRPRLTRRARAHLTAHLGALRRSAAASRAPATGRHPRSGAKDVDFVRG